ncbi:Flp family type IVb pilin [Olsenella sp. oral taxon 807]|uniref:Flp family type IVb pilin n=1 Tax=Olsenella sp. oral taxon 807 TaxID=712411 RepID=UPI000A9AB497|nr:Flp family type IVb pilin [Olsenella sp. oral taxon 807]
MIRKLVNEESGQGLVEYAMILVLVSVVAIASVTGLSNNLHNIYNNSINQLP